MGKLIVDKFERLQNIRGTEFYKIIGIIKSYNYETGRIEIISLFDQTSCEIELDLESNANQEVIEIHNGLVVDAEVVNHTISIITSQIPICDL